MTKVTQLRKDVEVLKRALDVGPQPAWKKRHEELQPLLKELNDVGYNSQILRDAAKAVAKDYAERKL